MKTRLINIEVQMATDIAELSATEQTLIEKAKDAAMRAYAPYSNFKVGACLMLDNGETIEGNNQENASYPCGCCAERTALHYAKSKYPNAKVNCIAIAAFNCGGLLDTPITPCGICRQALLEEEANNKENIKVMMVGKNYTNIVRSISNLLPLSFDNSQL